MSNETLPNENEIKRLAEDIKNGLVKDSDEAYARVKSLVEEATKDLKARIEELEKKA